MRSKRTALVVLASLALFGGACEADTDAEAPENPEVDVPAVPEGPDIDGGGEEGGGDG